MFLPLKICSVMDIKTTPFYLVIIYSFFHILNFCFAKEFILPAQLITDSESIVSSGQIFRLGFFSPGNSSYRYVGVWYNTLPGEKIVVWIANRDNPLKDSSGVLRITGDGNLVVLDGEQTVMWTTNISVAASSSIAELLDSGNLVLRQVNSGDSTERIIWQSFDHPGNTFSKDMYFGTNIKTGEKSVIAAWNTDSDPSTGSFHIEVEPLNVPQLVVWNGSQRHWRSGPWDGKVFIGIEGMIVNYNNKFDVLHDEQGGNVRLAIFYSKRPVFLRLVMEPTGQVREYVINKEGERWFNDWTAPDTDCHIYGKCGPFGFCNILSSPICSCLRGYEPISTKEWSKGNWSDGCIRRKPLMCLANNTNGKEDGFLKYEKMKVPDFVKLALVDGLDLCKQSCLTNCSCTAYSYVRGIGCMLWYGILLDVEMFSVDGVDLYIRGEYAELANSSRAERTMSILLITLVIGATAFGLGSLFIWKKRNLKGNTIGDEVELPLYSKRDDPELPLFDLATILSATNNFSKENKLGEGGFGAVYKGRLDGEEEIAVKRLSKNSIQGVTEFKNEVILISKLQHRNLVRILGCCVQGKEKMLVYEYMQNNSLDSYIFDETKRRVLDWEMRSQIILGIARGLLYLHHDSRLRIIHRDLKASNVLLDKDMVAKISDFGLARICQGDNTETRTKVVVGTRGYMSPEYAVDGYFSVKSDVFSYGVLILEIISGKRNRGFFHQDHGLNLLGHAWRLWNEGKTMELVDILIYTSGFVEDISRCIHIGLLCVQKDPQQRPTMSSVVLMLSSEGVALPQPQHPGFYIERSIITEESSSEKGPIYSNNDVTITMLEAR